MRRMVMTRTYIAGLFALAAFLPVAGCMPLAPDEYKEAIPEEDDLKVIMGSADTDGTAASALLDPNADCPECCILTVGDDESYIDGDIFQLTRSAIWHVNGGLATTFAWIRLIVSYPYSQRTRDGFIWGPWDDTNVNPLSRLSFRFVMDRNDDGVFVMSLEARSINDDSDNWQAIAYGEVLPAGRPHLGSGFIVSDFGKLHELDSAHPTKLHGEIRYDFDVSRAEPTEANPNTVKTTFKAFYEEPGKDNDIVLIDAVYEYERYDELAGMFRFTAGADFTGPGDKPDGTDESFAVESRWTQTGKGRGVATVTGGSIPGLDLQSYTLTECWADSTGLFYQTYRNEAYTAADGSSANETMCGDESSCPVW